MKPDFDVVIVGGGPSGVIAAYAIAKSGFSCVLLDKKPLELIGAKNCGDALDALHTDLIHKHLGIEPPQLSTGEARERIKYITIAAVDLETKFSAETPGYLVDRLAYGQRLLKEAIDVGVDIRPECTVRGILQEGDFIVGVRYFQQGKSKELRAKITIDASGYIGVIRKLIPSELCNGVNYEFLASDSIGTYREIIKLNSPTDHDFREEIVLLYHKDIPPPGYAWIFSEGEKMLNIGITWDKSISYPDNKTMKKIYHDCLDPLIPPDSYEIIHKGGGNIPMRPNFDSLVVNGGMIVGDAGGLADPTTFEGHGPALESGRLAANAAIAALKSNSFGVKDLWTYNQDIMKYPGAMHAQSYLAARLLQEIKADGLHFLLDKEIITEDELRKIFQEKEANISFINRFKKFIRAFPKWGLMFKIRKYIDLIETAEEIYAGYPDSVDSLNEWRKLRNKKLQMNF